jgi:hypothetical protein
MHDPVARQPPFPITIQSDDGHTLGECLYAEGRRLTGRTPARPGLHEQWLFRVELGGELGDIVGRLRIESVDGDTWNARVVAIRRADRPSWDRWVAAQQEQRAEPVDPPSTITIESLDAAHREGRRARIARGLRRALIDRDQPDREPES